MMYKKVSTKRGLGSLLDMVCGNVSKHSTRRRSRWPRYQNNHLRHVSHVATPETLERRFAFDVTAFAATGLDQVTIVVSDGDDLYLTQTVNGLPSTPDTLNYGTSSFYPEDGSDGGQVSDFARKTKLMIAEGRSIKAPLIKSDGSPAWGRPGLSRESFFLPKNVPPEFENYPEWRRLNTNLINYNRSGSTPVERPTEGSIELTQPDGTVSTWEFTNWNQEDATARFNNQDIKIVKGPNYGREFRLFNGGTSPDFQALTPGYYYPERIFVEDDGQPGTFGPTSTGFRVEWNQPISQSANPTIELDQYETETRDLIVSERVSPASHAFPYESPVLSTGEVPSPGSFYQVDYTLQDAEGYGLIPGALSGSVSLPNYGELGSVKFTGTDVNVTDIRSSARGSFELNFEQIDGTFAPSFTYDRFSVGQQGALNNFNNPGPLRSIRVDGFYNALRGTITLRFQQGAGAKPGVVELTDVNYAIFDAATLNSDTQPTSVYVQPGLDIDTSMTVELLSPGTALYVGNPISATGNPGPEDRPFQSPVTEGSIALRASEIYLNADISADQRIDIGSTTEVAQNTGAAAQDSPGVTLAVFRENAAVINVQGGQLEQMQPVLGYEGSGYRPFYEPKVAVTRPVEAKAIISPGRFIGGLAGISLENRGDGYTQFDGVTPITISGPNIAGWDEDNDGTIDYPAVQATATANYVDGRIAGIVLTNPGFGYTEPPTITIPPPARKLENGPGNTVIFQPVQARVGQTFGGVLESLSIDFGGFNYDEQAADYSTPRGVDPNDDIYRPRPADEDLPKTIITVTNLVGGSAGEIIEVYPLVGPSLFIAQAPLPPGGLRGDVILTKVPDPVTGGETTKIEGNYSWLATVDANGTVVPSFTIEANDPTPLNPLDNDRPVITATVGEAGRITEYIISLETPGEGYGVIPGIKIEEPGRPEEPSELSAKIIDGKLVVIPKKPNLVFDVAKNEDSFVENDDKKPNSQREIAKIEILFKNETITELRDDGEFARVNDYSVWDDVPLDQYEDADDDALFKNEITRTLLLQKHENTSVDESGNEVQNFKDVLEIKNNAIVDKLDFFSGELFAIGDIALDILGENYDSPVDREKIESIGKEFGQEYRLVVKKKQKLTYIQPNGSTVPLTYTPPEEQQSIGRAYLGTGYGYRSEPVVQVQQTSAENKAAEFKAILDKAGRVKEFEKKVDGDAYKPDEEYVVAISSLRNAGATEIVEFNSTISAAQYDIRVADDVRDNERLKGEVFVSPISIVGNGVGSPSDSVYIEADTADVYVAGGINAKIQSYMFQSPIYRQLDGPFTFSTRNPDTGFSSGTLEGEVLTLAFGAETTVFNSNKSIITHEVDLDTNLSVETNDPTNLTNSGSLRVTAGANREGSFPVDINVRNLSSLNVDSDVRSSGAVAITAISGSLNVNAAIKTDGDLTLAGGLSTGRVRLSGPLTSTRGSISVAGGGLDVQADVVAEGQGEVGDILLRATGGDVDVAGIVRTGDNGKIEIQQDAPSVVQGLFESVVSKTTGKGDTAKTTLSTELNLTIDNTKTTTAELNVGQAPADFDRITVSLDIDHTFVGDLTGVVTAPSGEQYTLFSRNGGSSDDYRNITFDNASPRSLRSSPTPYSGEYSPFEFLATPNSSEGTWTFTVTDAFGGDSGTLNAFSLRFIGAVGGSEGAAGVVKGFGVLESEQIIVRAKGSVGSADSGIAGLLKTKSSDVDVYSTFGSVGLRSLQAGQFQIDAPAAVAISSLGTDVVGRFGELTPALRADVRSAQSVAFEAPDGSIRADIESPSTVEITGFGNGISPVAAGSVDIRVVDSDVVVRDAPIGGEGVVDVDKVVKYSDLENAQLYGDVEGYVAGRIEGEGILDGSYTAGDKVLVVGDQVGTDLPAVSFVMDQLGQELKVRIVDGGGGYTIDTDIAVIFSTSPTGDTMTGVANSDDTGQIASITITNPGSGYSDTSPPTITIASPVSGGSTATAVIEYCVTVAGDRVKRLDEDGNSFDVMTTDYPGWEPVAAGEYSGKREIVWGYKNDPAANVSMITVWTLALDDSFWNGDETVYRSTDFGFMEVERRYQNDIDNDGSIGLTLIENHGSVRLELADDQQPIVDGYGVTISRGNKVYKTPEWSPVAAETVGGKNIIAWQKTQGEGTGGFLLWVCNNNWERVEGYVEPSPGTLQHGQLEVSLDLDLNGDGVKGITSDEGLRGNLIAISEGGVVFVNGNAVTKDGKDITADAYLGWRVLSAAEDTSTGGYTLLWGHASGRVAEWILNSSSAYVSDKVIPTPGDEPAFSDFIDVVQEKYQVSLSNAGFWALMPTQTITTPPVEVMKAYAPERYTGVYEVVSTGGMSQNWRLVRSVDLNTGSEFADRLMIRDMSEDKYLQIERLVGQIGNNSNGVSSRAYEVGNPETKITTASDKNMTYVVSQNNGDNQTTGSFGRVISLIEQNRIGDRRVNIGFSERVTTITPTQELPEISRSLNLDGSKRWVTSDGVSQMIDVVFDENGNASSSSASLPAGIQPVGLSGSLVTVDRENNPVSVFSDRVINGIVLTGVVGDRGQGNGQGSSQSQIAGIRNIEIGGFDDGAGILIEKSNNVIVEGVVLGAGGLANLSGNDVGIRIAGSRDVTMNEVQVSSNNVGLLVEDGDVVDAVEKLGDVPAKDLPNNASSKITNVNTTDLTIGMTVSGGDVPVGATILSIESPTQLTLSAPVITGTGTTDVPLTLVDAFDSKRYVSDSNRVIGTRFIDNEVGARLGGTGSVKFGVGPVFDQPFVAFRRGETKITLTDNPAVDYPALWEQMHVGMAVAGENVPPGTRIVGIDRVRATIQISQAVLKTVPSTEKVQLTLGEAWQVTDTDSRQYPAQLNTGSAEALLTLTNFNSIVDAGEINYGTPVFGEGVAPGTFVLALDEAAQAVVLSRPIGELASFNDPTVQIGFAVGNDVRNTIEGSRVGIELSDGQHQLIRNTIRNNEVGILVSGSYDEGRGHDVGLSNANKSGFANIIENNSKYGVLVFEDIANSGDPDSGDPENVIKGGTRIAGNVFQSLGASPNAYGNIGQRIFEYGRKTDDVFGGYADNEYTPDLEGVDLRNNSHTPGAQVRSVTVPQFATIGTQTSPTFDIFGFCLDNPGATITIYATGETLESRLVLGTAIVDDNGVWNLTAQDMTTGLGSGIYQFTADNLPPGGTARSALSDVELVTVILDNEPPDAGEIRILTNVLTQPEPVIVGLCEPLCTVTLNINTATYMTTSNVIGQWTVDTANSPFSGGLGDFVHDEMYAITVNVTDSSQNTAGPVTAIVRYDNPPIIPPTPPEPEPPRRPTARRP